MKRRNFLRLLPTIVLLPAGIKTLPKPIPLPEPDHGHILTIDEMNSNFVDALGKMDEMILNRSKFRYSITKAQSLDNWKQL